MRESSEEKQAEEGLFKKIKSDYLKQFITSHLDLKVSAKLYEHTKSCLKYIADDSNSITNESLAIAKNKLYNKFLRMILVQKNIDFIYKVCIEICNKDTDRLFQKYEFTGQNKGKLSFVSCVYNIPKILCEILSITRSDFDKLNLKEKDLHGTDILNSMQTIIETILESKFSNERIHYLEKILLNPDEKVKMQELSLHSLPISMDNTEKKIRTVTYQEIQYKLICKLSDVSYKYRLGNYPQWTNKFDFSGVTSWNESYSSRNKIYTKMNAMERAYQEKYYMTVEQNIGSFDWIFMDLDDAEECYKEYRKAELNWRADEFKKNLFMSYQKALHRIFSDNKEKRVQFSEHKREAFNYWNNIDVHSKERLLKHCSLWFMMFVHVVWLLAIVLFITFCPIGNIALYIIAAKYGIVWLETIELLFGISFVWFVVPFYLGAFLGTHIPYVYKHYTISQKKYNDYVNQMYFIPNIEKNSVFDGCKKFKTEIVNLENRLELAKKTLCK